MIDYPDIYSNQQFISAKKHHEEWPESDRDEIKMARIKYDAGTHEMATKRFKGHDFLLLIKRREPTARREYFRYIGRAR